jgi:hypothetical protein
VWLPDDRFGMRKRCLKTNLLSHQLDYHIQNIKNFSRFTPIKLEFKCACMAGASDPEEEDGFHARGTNSKGSRTHFMTKRKRHCKMRMNSIVGRICTAATRRKVQNSSFRQGGSNDGNGQASNEKRKAEPENEPVL